MNHYLATAGGILTAAVLLRGLLTTSGYAGPNTSFQRVRSLQQLAQKRPLTTGEVDQLLGWASDADWRVRCRSLAALLHVSTFPQKEKALGVMRAALKDKEYVVRAYAARGLRRCGDTQDIPALEPLLRDPQPSVRN